MIRALVHTLICRFLVLLIMIVLCVPTLIFLLLPEKIRYHNKLCNYLQFLFYWLLMKSSLLSITVYGRENIPSTPAVIVANHQSSLDIPIIGVLLRSAPHVWLATNDLLSSPLWRFILPRTAVLVDMSTPLKGMRTLLTAIAMLYDQKLYSIVFPEGGRFSDGAIHDFFGGFVILAKKTGQPVVPVRIFNLNRAYPKGTFFIHWYPIKVIVGKPMRQHEHETDAAFSERVQAWFCEQKGD